MILRSYAGAVVSLYVCVCVRARARALNECATAIMCFWLSFTLLLRTWTGWDIECTTLALILFLFLFSLIRSSLRVCARAHVRSLAHSCSRISVSEIIKFHNMKVHGSGGGDSFSSRVSVSNAQSSHGAQHTNANVCNGKCIKFLITRLRCSFDGCIWISSRRSLLNARTRIETAAEARARHAWVPKKFGIVRCCCERDETWDA